MRQQRARGMAGKLRAVFESDYEQTCARLRRDLIAKEREVAEARLKYEAAERRVKQLDDQLPSEVRESESERQDCKKCALLAQQIVENKQVLNRMNETIGKQEKAIQAAEAEEATATKLRFDNDLLVTNLQAKLQEERAREARLCHELQTAYQKLEQLQTKRAESVEVRYENKAMAQYLQLLHAQRNAQREIFDQTKTPFNTRGLYEELKQASKHERVVQAVVEELAQHFERRNQLCSEATGLFDDIFRYVETAMQFWTAHQKREMSLDAHAGVHQKRMSQVASQLKRVDAGGHSMGGTYVKQCRDALNVCNQKFTQHVRSSNDLIAQVRMFQEEQKAGVVQMSGRPAAEDGSYGRGTPDPVQGELPAIPGKSALPDLAGSESAED